MRVHSTPTIAALCAVTCSACSGVLAKGDGRAIGDDLGRFAIDAKLDDSTCGRDALGVEGDTSFKVFLSEAPPLVYWNAGAQSVEGDLEPDGVHFSFQSETVLAVPGAASAADTCTIVRSDTASGTFDDPKTVTKLHGTLEYHYAVQGHSDCSAAMVQQGFTALPCRVRYTMDGKYVSAR
jgi:hypothetical protein